MWKFAVILMCLSGYCSAGPVGPKRNMPVVQQRYEDAPVTETESANSADPNEMTIMSSLTLPSNATSIRADITDGFSCENKTYGYYADVDNDCQIFHVCLPVTYADGKENTFRWSFICPEDTIFSQDSFTCMRPDDMTISCEESYQYYELNRNFGMVDSQTDKESNNEAAGTAAESNENVSEAEAEPVKPAVQQEEEQVIGQSKPVNVHKRRRPTTSYTTQKKPANTYPLRKMPQSQMQTQVSESPATQVMEEVNENIKPLEEEEIKPITHKFSRRPVTAMTNSMKDKIQSIKPETVTASRTELFNQLRKRPSLFNKKPAEQPEEDSPAKVEIGQEQQNFSPVESDVSISNTETQVADAEIEASESNHVFVKPVETNDTPHIVENTFNAPEEPVQILEAFEEIPAVISEVVETPKAEEEEASNEQFPIVSNEKSDTAEEPQIIEEAQSAEEEQISEDTHTLSNGQPIPETQEQDTAADTQTPEETQVAAEAETAETAQELQTADEIAVVPQSLRTSAEEIQNLDNSKAIEEMEIIEEAQKSPAAEEQQNVEELPIAEESETPEEVPVVEESETAEEITTVEEAQKMEIPEEAKVVEEPQIAEELQAAEETSDADNTETAAELQVVKEEVAEVPQSLRTSAEEIQEHEINMSAEEIANVQPQTVEEMSVEDVHAPSEPQEELKAIEIDEQVQSAEETQGIPEAQSSETSENNDEEPIVPVEESLVVEEPQPVVHKIEESQVPEESVSVEDSKPLEENIEPENIPSDTQVAQTENENIAESAILEEERSEGGSSANIADLAILEEEHSEEGASANLVSGQTIEQMESEKPAEAPALMPATEEMNQPDNMVQQMAEDMSMNAQSVGGFKPVDPVMAHEAEQLIVDFINTLRKNDFTNETPGMHIEHPADEVSEEQEAHISPVEVQEEESIGSNSENEEETVKLEDIEHQAESAVEISENQADAVEDTNEEMQDAAEVKDAKQEEEVANEEDKEINDFDALKSLEMHETEDSNELQKSEEAPIEAINLPQEMYQIPVQVIAAPVQEMTMTEEESHESDMKSPEIADTANTEEIVQEETPAMPMAGNKPMSIDDIVELVKERLDHMPKEEMETPMQLEQVLVDAQEDKAEEPTSEDQSPVQEAEQQIISQSEEESVMPIYQRTVQLVPADSGVPAEDLTQDLNEDQSGLSDDAKEIKEKTNRSYRPRNMLTPKLDSRKRHFLFKADSS